MGGNIDTDMQLEVDGSLRRRGTKRSYLSDVRGLIYAYGLDGRCDIVGSVIAAYASGCCDWEEWEADSQPVDRRCLACDIRDSV